VLRLRPRGKPLTWRIRQLRKPIVIEGQLYRWCNKCWARNHSGAGAGRGLPPLRLVEGIFSRLVLDRDLARRVLGKELDESFARDLIRRLKHGNGYAVGEARSILRRHLSAERAEAMAVRRCNATARREEQKATDGWKWPKQAESRIVAARVGPRFRACPVCRLVIYWADKSRPFTAFHPECAELYRRTPVYRAWKGRHVRGSSEPFPWPESDRVPRQGRPRGLARDAETLLMRYRWLMQKIDGKSFRALSKRRRGSSHRSKSAISEGVAAFLELLPGSWRHVFRYKGQKRTAMMLAKLFTLPAHRSDRSDLIQHLATLGMSEEKISTLIGEPLPRVKKVLSELAKPSAIA
jgi:hypothetical protein